MSPLQNSKNDWLNNQQQQMKASIQEPASNTRKQQPSDTNVYKKAKVTHQQDTHIPCFTLLSPSMREQEHTLSSFPTTIKAINTRLAAHPKKHSYDNSNNDENAAVENMAKSSLKTRISPLLSPDDSDEDLLRTGTGLTPLAAQLRINAFKQQQQQHVQRPMQQNTLPSRPFLPGYPLVEEQQVSISKNDIGNDDVSLSLSAANKASLVLPSSTMDGIARDVPLEEERVALEVYQHAHGEYAKYEDVSHAVQNEKNVTTTTSSIIAAAATAAAVPLKFHTTNNNNYPRSLLALQPPPKQQQYAKNPLAPSYSNSSSFLPSVLTFDSISHTLTSFEKSEILHYNTIYYAGKMAIKKIQGRLNAKEHNYGYDDRHGNYHIVLHDHIAYRYEILHLLGCGSFGQVVRCLDHATGRPVALKIIKNKENFKNQARMEATILTQLCRHEHHGSTHIVQMMDSFVFRNHVCITFELLSLNLYEYIKENSFNGCGITMVRGIAGQVLRTLCFLRLQKIVHCDIKPENILMTSKGSSSIKVIDFGSACYENQRVFAYIQSRFYSFNITHRSINCNSITAIVYRAPEVILGQPYGAPIDMWSLGCVLAELAIGVPLFPGENETEQLYCIMEVMGLPPFAVIRHSSRACLFFDMTTGAPLPAKPNSKGLVRRPGSMSLGGLMQTYGVYDMRFVQFLQRCLHWDPVKRMTPEEALQHQWMAVGSTLK